MKFSHHFFSRWQNWLGFGLVLLFVVMAVAAPVLSPQDSKSPGMFKRVGRALDHEPHPPNATSLLGTLPTQYDIFHTIVWGARDALRFGLLVAMFSALLGTFYGAIAGYAGRTINRVMMRVSDAFLAFPVIAGVVFLEQLVAIAVESSGGIFVSSWYSQSSITASESIPILIVLKWIDPLLFSLVIFSWMPYARLVNTIVVGLKNMEFVQAARAIGARPFYIIRRHLIPNSISPAIVLAARDVGSVVILQATFTFIHIGGNSPWGELLSLGRNYVLGPGGSLFTYWWVYIPATVAVILFGISWNLLGDGLNDMLDPYYQ